VRCLSSVNLGKGWVKVCMKPFSWLLVNGRDLITYITRWRIFGYGWVKSRVRDNGKVEMGGGKERQKSEVERRFVGLLRATMLHNRTFPSN
jgi:hypothetical protein